jgi:RNA polymerase sigma factor (sigma-70 family)
MSLDFAQVYDEHVEHVYAFIAYRLDSATDAEDLTQLTFERALKAWSRYDERKASVGTWLLAIARNAVIDHRRRDRSSGPTRLTDETARVAREPSEPGPQDRLGPSPELSAALHELDQRERDILALRFGADLRTAEIAEIMDLSVANVQQVLSRTLRKLRGSLEPGRADERAPDAHSAQRAATGR